MISVAADIWRPVYSGAGSSPPSVPAILMEDGSYILLEDGFKLLLE